MIRDTINHAGDDLSRPLWRMPVLRLAARREVAARHEVEREARTTPGALTALLFRLGLGLTTSGIIIARGSASFEWLPAGLRTLKGIYIVNFQAVLVGSAVALIGAALAGLAASKALD